MAQFGSEFDASQVAPSEPRVALPDGDYPMIIEASEWKKTKDGNGTYLELTLQVIDGQYKGRKVWDRLNLDNQSQQAVEIAQRTLSAICHATGVLRVSDSSQVHNLPMLVKVKASSAENNDVKGYRKMDGAVAPAPAPVAAAAPARTAPAAPAGPVTAPWNRKAS